MRCGTLMIWQEIEDRQREVCPSCGWIHYEQLKVGAGAIIEDANKLLLLQRANNPRKEQWNIPAGYAESDENPAQTAIRETLEETGLQIEIIRQLYTYYYADDPRGNGLMVLFQGHVVGGEIRNSSESTAIKYFDRKNLPVSLAGGGHDQAVTAWLNREFKTLASVHG
jgi:ADP-ribose pyrophosphatase YjhB (NUDIX family)